MQQNKDAIGLCIWVIFFDAPNLCSEDLTALKEIIWAEDIPHYFLVGNHEIGTRNLQFNSVNVLTNNSPYKVIDKITNVYPEDLEVVFIPYTFEDNRPSIYSLFKSSPGLTAVEKRIVFSHNDLKGMQMGKYISEEGFDMEDIKSCCDLFINGHYHNGEKIENIINCGNLTGQNFGEDASKYDHVALILDTETMKVAVFENPYAFNFYKIDFYENSDIDYINKVSDEMRRNSVCSIRCAENDLHYLKCRFGNDADELIPKCNKIIVSRFVIVPNVVTNKSDVVELSSVDHLDLFKEYITQTLGNDEIIMAELAEVCK